MVSADELLKRWVSKGKGGRQERRLHSKLVKEVAERVGYPFEILQEGSLSERAAQAAKDLGYTDTVLTNPSKYDWDGKKGYVYLRDPETFIHEVSHWQVCPQWRRKFPEFGLGSQTRGLDPDAEVDDPPVQISNKAIDWDEWRASILGILWLDKLDLAPLDMAVDHSWVTDTADSWRYTRPSKKHIPVVLRWLHRHGLIDLNGMPLYMRR